MTGPIWQQVVSPEVSAAYRGGFEQVEGFVVQAGDVTFARTAAEVIDAFGYGAVVDAFLSETGYVEVLRFAGPLLRARVAYGPAMAEQVGEGEGPLLREPAPFTGTGFTACAVAAVPQWRLARTRLPAGTELWRVDAVGHEQLVDVYRDAALGWAGGSNDGVPSRFLGPVAALGEAEYVADLIEDGSSVVLTALGPQPPAGFEQAGQYRSRRVVPAGEVGVLTMTEVSCVWREQPFQVFAATESEVLLTYTGGDAEVAERLGLRFVQPFVYEAVAPRSEVGDLTSQSWQREIA